MIWLLSKRTPCGLDLVVQCRHESPTYLCMIGKDLTLYMVMAWQPCVYLTWQVSMRHSHAVVISSPYCILPKFPFPTKVLYFNQFLSARHCFLRNAPEPLISLDQVEKHWTSPGKLLRQLTEPSRSWLQTPIWICPLEHLGYQHPREKLIKKLYRVQRMGGMMLGPGHQCLAPLNGDWLMISTPSAGSAP